MSPATRVLALWSPDWPVTAAAMAAHSPLHLPAAVIVANRVLACSAVARSHGVRRGMRRREAQARCPELVVLDRDDDRDARAFEPVVAAIEELAPGVEIVRPGLVALAAQGPVGWFGGEQAAAEKLVDQVAARTRVECQVGVADGLFAAVLAARRGVAVAPGDTPAFLAPLGVEELDREPDVDRSELVGLLHRLGLRSLGALGTLDAEDVASRFGADAVLCHRLARGLDPRPPIRRRPPEELTAEIELDPPVDRVDAAAFAARGLAEQLHRTLAGHGLSCTRLGVAARTVAGEELYRIWRCAEPLTPAGTVDRVRWQLDAWLTQRARGRSLAASAEAATSEGPARSRSSAGVVAPDGGSASVPAERARPPTAFAGKVSDGRPASSPTRWAGEAAGRRLAAEADDVGAPDDGSGALARLWLVPEETVTAGALQLGLWGEVGKADERAGRALVRVQALLGPESVVTAVLVGGRDPADQVRLVPWGDDRDLGLAAPAAGPGPVAAPAVDGSEFDPGPLSFAGSTGAAGAVPVGEGGAGPTLLPVGGGTGSEPPPAGPVTSAGGSGLGPVPSSADAQAGGGRGGLPGVVSGGIAEHAPLRDAAPAGWPQDVVRRTGRVSAADVDKDGQPTRGRTTNRRRRAPAPRRSTGRSTVREPAPSWPGRLPAPSPATVPPQPFPAELVDVAGCPVYLTAPDLLSAAPHHVVVDGKQPREVRGWAGPWPLHQRWWGADGAEGSRLQVAVDDGVALLLLVRDGRWWVTGVYD